MGGRLGDPGLASVWDSEMAVGMVVRLIVIVFAGVVVRMSSKTCRRIVQPTW